MPKIPTCVTVSFSLAALVAAAGAADATAGYRTLHTFCFNCTTDGQQPMSSLVADAAGNLYGTTYSGGAHGYGTVFKITAKSKESVLYSFCVKLGCTDGALPQGGSLFLDSAGNLIGTTTNGGANDKGNDEGTGVVFKLTPKGRESVVYTFCSQGSCGDGANPYAGVIGDANGYLYGTTTNGGANSRGTVYRIAPDGTETVLYSFCSQANCWDGANPGGGNLLMDKKGNLYGTTINGGWNADASGTFFRLTPKAKETVLYTFCGNGGNCTDGKNPYGGVVADKYGNFYGTTEYGGAEGYGTVFKVTPKGKETVVHSFCTLQWCQDGTYPMAGLYSIKGGATLYGTASDGDVDGGGVVFSISHGKEKVLHSFKQGNDDYATTPMAAVILLNGYLYGTTRFGGQGQDENGSGVVFRLGTKGDAAPR